MEPVGSVTKLRSVQLNETSYMYNSVRKPGFVYELNLYKDNKFWRPKRKSILT